jgi:hypothetical protein
LADEYQVKLTMKAGPFKIDDSEPTVIRKTELMPAEKKEEKPAENTEEEPAE